MLTFDVATVRTRGRALLRIADALTVAMADRVPNAAAYPYGCPASWLLVVPDGNSVVTLLVTPAAVVVADDGPQLDMPVDGVAAVLARTAVADLVAAA